MGETKEHEAGYDAYMTGVIFIFFSKFLAAKFQTGLWEALRTAKHKISLFNNNSSHIDFGLPDFENSKSDRENVIKLLSLYKKSAKEVAKDLAVYGDIEVLMVEENHFFANFSHINSRYTIETILESLNQSIDYKAENFENRNLIKPH